jgi:transposase InsO family protein
LLHRIAGGDTESDHTTPAGRPDHDNAVVESFFASLKAEIAMTCCYPVAGWLVGVGAGFSSTSRD